MPEREQVTVARVRQGLGSLLVAIEKSGAQFVIVRNGKPVAMLGPIPQEQPVLRRVPGTGVYNDEAVKDILGRAFGKKK